MSPHRPAVLSDWRSVRQWEAATRQRLRTRHSLRWHGWGIGLLVLAAMWAAAHLQMMLGSDSLALRYLVTLAGGYLVFLLLLRWWAGALVGERHGLDGDAGIDLPGGRSPGDCAPGRVDAEPAFESGGGGDFGGGGAQADFAPIADSGSAFGDLASGAAEAAGTADEGAIVVVPVLAVFVIGWLVAMGAGSLLLLYFGWDVLLAVAVEVAFSYVSARTAVKLAREGWLPAAVRLTWKPLLGALACAVLLGAALDFFVPAARSLPHALQLLRQSA